ncbi:PVC-type heme-binding CxxCH protein [Rubinisphaera margarita]|uniref:PVC-type heme-binding CxxCH protein n=1 Tax=Rubinisphaera margarita TaxID=2909586 RepID=UPI001EE89DBD|nr:PVC-type heme-binding CxxCH protein [Rubinisphaera margarita]MCG6156248.1 c-type cytochrome [Rubinisphaera margarita]
MRLQYLLLLALVALGTVLLPQLQLAEDTAEEAVVESAAEVDDFPQPRTSPSERHLSPMPAERAADSMELPDGFKATVFAAEPDVSNPIAMAWDDSGRLWVAENYTYAERSQRFDLSLRDRVLIFADSDNDGHADSRTVFTDDVQMLTSVEVGRGGVWLMCPPALLFIPDANGDDVPDGPPVVMLDGFDVARNNYHNFANGLRWGPDGWLYGRCGHSCPGLLGTPGTPEEERVPIDGGIWRFHPERKIVEVLCHGTTNPWGHDWDENGELFFINTVIGHLWHMLPGSHFKEPIGESQNRAVYERMDMIADHYHFDTSGSWTESRDGAADDLGGGHAHSGMLIHQSEHWPAKYRGRLMTLNFHGRRANVERLERTQTGYVGRHEPDFLQSQDPFFRGIDLSQGPDGSLFVIDWSDTGECHDHTGVHRESGRIFKISYQEPPEPGEVFKPACLQGEGDLQQLWTDYQYGRMSYGSLRKLARHSDEHVRVWAIRLLTDFWPLDTLFGPLDSFEYPDDPKTIKLLIRMGRDDPSGLVHRILASTLQRMPVENRTALAIELVKREEYADEHQLALLTWYGLIPVAQQRPEDIIEVAGQCQWPSLHYSIARHVTTQIDDEPELLDRLLSIAGRFSKSSQEQIVRGIDDALRGRRSAPMPASWPTFTELQGPKALDDTTRDLSIMFGDERALAAVRRIAVDTEAQLEARQKALGILIEMRPHDLREICESLMNDQTLNVTAARGLGLFDDPEIGVKLASSYMHFAPHHRPSIIETLASRASFAGALLEAIADEQGTIPRTDVTAVHARQIQSLGNESLTQRLSEVWGELRESSGERRKMIETLKGQLTEQTLHAADLSAGRTLFNKTCSQCHLLYGEGNKVGPDLTGSQRANLDYLLENILDPSAVVSKDYQMTIIVTVDGRVLNGLVLTENEQALTLRTATEEVTVNRDDIEDQQQTPLSAMPDGLLQNLSEEQTRDLIAYLMHPRQVPLPATGDEQVTLE